jgi:conjugation system TraG family ATPase
MLIVVLIVAAVALAAAVLKVKVGKDNTRLLESHLPIWKVEDDYIISKAGDITIAYELTLPEIFCMSNEEYEALHQLWAKAIKLLPAQTIIHRQDWYIKANYQGDFAKHADDFLMLGSERSFHERPFMEHTCYLYITKTAPERRLASSAFHNLLKRRLVPVESVNAEMLQKLSDAAGQVEKLLSSTGQLALRRMTADELCGTTDKAGLIERYCFLQQTDTPAVVDLQFKPELKIGNHYCQLYSLAEVESMPSMVGPRVNYDKYCTDRTKFSIGFATPVGLLLPHNHIYNQFIYIGDGQKTIKNLEAKRLRLQSLSAYSRQNLVARDAVNDFLNEAISEQRQPVKVHYNILSWTDNRDELKELRNQVSTALVQMEAVPKLETRGAGQLFWSAIPGNAAEMPSNELFDTFAEQATCLFQMDTAYRSSTSPFGIRLGDRLSGVPLHVDISDEVMQSGVCTNRNKLVVGPSGTGKSLLLNGILYGYWVQGSHIVVIDVGHSYRGLCTLVGGYYFTYDEKAPLQFNPFYLSEGDFMDTEKKESIKTLLLALWKKEDETFTRAEYVALSNALTLYFEHLDRNPSIFPCFNTFYEFVQDEYVQVLQKEKVQDKHFDVHNFLYVLRPYYKDGEFSFLLNATKNLDVLHQRFVVFELDNIAGHAALFPIVTLIIMELFISKLRKLKGVRKVIVIEEAWKAISKGSMAEFLRYLYKTVRKHFGEAITATQEVDDLIGSPIVKDAIVGNADCKILLDMRKFMNKFDGLQQALGLSAKAKTLLLSLNKANERGRRYREIFIDLGGQIMKVYRYEPSPQEYYCFTTEEKEKVLVQQYVAKNGGDMAMGIRALLADMKEKEKTTRKP